MQANHEINSMLFVALADMVGHHRASCAKGLGLALRRVAGGLVLGLGIELRTEQNNHRRNVQPDHEPDAGTQRAIDPIVAVKSCNIP